MTYGVGCKCSSDPALLWLWCRLVAAAPTGPLAWEPPCAKGAALEMEKRQKKNLAKLAGEIDKSTIIVRKFNIHLIVEEKVYTNTKSVIT